MAVWGLQRKGEAEGWEREGRQREDLSIRMPADEFRVCDFGQWPDLCAFQKPHLKLDTNTPAS